MIVSELIEKLKECSQDAIVVIDFGSGDVEITSVITLEAKATKIENGVIHWGDEGTEIITFD